MNARTFQDLYSTISKHLDEVEETIEEVNERFSRIFHKIHDMPNRPTLGQMILYHYGLQCASICKHESAEEDNQEAIEFHKKQMKLLNEMAAVYQTLITANCPSHN